MSDNGPDNGPQYASLEFKKFSKDWEFQHYKTSSAGSAQSNGRGSS